jgi:hypothetical protein
MGKPRLTKPKIAHATMAIAKELAEPTERPAVPDLAEALGLTAALELIAVPLCVLKAPL